MSAAADDASAIVDRLAAAVGAVERRETHGSWVLLTPTRAFKVKKPVAMAFLDYGTPARRRAMCRAEVELNRRAAPDIYLGVHAVVADGDGVALAPDDDPGALEYVVEMRRFPEAGTLAAALAADAVSAEAASRIGGRLARFHEQCEPVPLKAGAEAVKRSLDDDFASLATLVAGDPALARDLVAAERCAASFLGARWAELDARARAGRVRDGHGDLRAEHVLLEPEALVDAIEFDPALRRIDAGLDLAFLVMDLHAAGRPELARALLTGYREAGGDPGDDRLVAFFAAYRARVRAKVALLRAEQLSEASATGDAERERAARLLRLGTRLLWTARGPAVVAIAGVAASGKSTLARALAERSGMPSLSSDVVRKRLAGVGPADRAPDSAYRPAVTGATYRELGRLSAEAWAEVVLVDATFHRRASRDAFRAALGPAAARLIFVECRAPAELLERRLRVREQDSQRVSDATADVLRRQLAGRDPFDEVPAGAHLIVRSDQPVETLVTQVEEALDRPARPV